MGASSKTCRNVVPGKSKFVIAIVLPIVLAVELSSRRQSSDTHAYFTNVVTKQLHGKQINCLSLHCRYTSEHRSLGISGPAYASESAYLYS